MAGKQVTKRRSTEDRPRPMTSLVAAAGRITSRTMERRAKQAKAEEWQREAWDYFDQVGEQRFLATTLSNQAGRARLYVGRMVEGDNTADPERVTEGLPAEVFDSLGSMSHVGQMITRLNVNLFIPGDAWLVGIPRDLIPTEVDNDLSETPIADRLVTGTDVDAEELDLTDLEWRALSVSEVDFDKEKVTLHLGDAVDEKVETSADSIWLVRVWRPHPNKWWLADSPTRSSLPVLRELVGLTKSIGAQIDSRLAGAGVFIVPSEARQALLDELGEDADEDADPFTDALLNAMLTPIKDRDNASAVVPLVVTVPGVHADKFRHISFATPFDEKARELREEAIRRLALGEDAPPEVLLGMSDSNHWGAWLVKEDTITTHVEPPLALICDALTTQFLHPVLMGQGMDEEEARQYVIWYDIDHLILRPNRATDAQWAYENGLIKDEVTRDALGFDPSDAPEITEEGEAATDPAVALALDLVRGAPTLLSSPGLPAIVEQIRAVLDGTPGATLPAPAPVSTDSEGGEESEGEADSSPSDDGGTPDTDEDPLPEAPSTPATPPAA